MSQINELNALWKAWETSLKVIYDQKNNRMIIDSNYEYRLQNSEYSFRGFSIAAFRTNFIVKELNIMFDAGISGYMSPEHIFITHCHSDHCANLPFHLYNAKPNTKTKIYAPKGSIDNISNYVKSAYVMSCDCSPDDIPLLKSSEMVPVTQGTFELVIKNKNFTVEIIECFHSVPCVGYGFTEKRNKLKDEYLGLSGKEIMELKKTGININKEINNHIFCFLGDTNKKVLENKEIDKYKTIIIECTFLFDSEITQANETQHMHWNYLEDYIKTHPDNNFVLYHFSMRYKKSQIIEFFDKLKLPNVTAWISH